MIAREIYDYEQQYAAFSDLKSTVLKAWNTLPSNVSQKVVSSMRKGCISVLRRSKNVICHWLAIGSVLILYVLIISTPLFSIFFFIL